MLLSQKLKPVDADTLTGKAAGDFASSTHGHSATKITTTTTKRFVSDTEKNNWNNKSDNGHNHSASDITSGTLAGDRLPLPTATDKGGVKVRVNGTSLYITTDGSSA